MRSGVTDQAENKLHMHKAIMAFLMADLGTEPRGSMTRGMSDEA
jgi:hypothetical protein